MTGARAEQVPTERVSLVAIMSTRAFERGLRDARAGRPFVPSYGASIDDQWDYERGRAFAVVAPRRMPLRIGGELNPAAIHLCAQRGVIL
jgi:hypothetical protein